jgi:hypothetical protein
VQHPKVNVSANKTGCGKHVLPAVIDREHGSDLRHSLVGSDLSAAFKAAALAKRISISALICVAFASTDVFRSWSLLSTSCLL